MMTYQFALLFCLSAALLQVQGNYELEVRFHSYSNPNNYDWQRNRCDTFSSGCDVMYFMCLRVYQYSPPTSNGDCTLGSQGTISHPHTIVGTYSFPSGANFPGGSGLSNPVIFTGDAWPGSFQLMVRLDDNDFNSPDLIDRVIPNVTLAVSTSFSSVRSQLGFYRIATLQLSFRVMCSQNFYGSDCTVFCLPQSSDALGHFTCNSVGERICSNEYTGADCRTPICSSTCQGSCSAPNLCDQCPDGYTGEFCGQCVLASGCHVDRAYCRLPGECICLPGYSGSLCQMDLDVCAHQSPCRNGATCTSTGPDQYTCDCPPGFTGRDCDMDVDYCLSSPCLNGATCSSLGPVEMFNCTCSTGWTGHLCTENIDECAVQSPCQNGGVCSDCVPSTQPSVIPSSSSAPPYCPLGYNCTCSEGYFGDRCETETDYCDPSPCLNGGVCADVSGGPGYTCTCPLGYTGQSCDVVVDLCGDSPCLNGGSCTSMPGSFSCACVAGYTGSVCDTEINECASSPCASNKTVECRDNVNGFTCVCMPGYTGNDCSAIINQCDLFGCFNEGTCTPLVNDFECECPEAFNGTRCENQLTHCSPNPCFFGGTCEDQVDDYFCQCPPSYTGDQCGEQVDICASRDCGENQFCQQTLELDAGYQCLPCVAGQAGCGVIEEPGKNSTQQGSRSQAGIIGGVVGGVVAALALLVCLLTTVCCLVRNNCCCAPVVKEENAVIDPESGDAQSNPLYFGASTLLSSNGSTLPHSYRQPFLNTSSTGGRALQEDGYISLDTVGTDSPSLPQAASMYNTFDQEHHYEHIPGQVVEEPEPQGPPALPADHRHSSTYDYIRPEERQPMVKSGKYDRLEKEMKPVLQSGKYDKLDKTSQPPPPPSSGKFNPYVLEPTSS